MGQNPVFLQPEPITPEKDHAELPGNALPASPSYLVQKWHVTHFHVGPGRSQCRRHKARGSTANSHRFTAGSMLLLKSPAPRAHTITQVAPRPFYVLN